MGRLKIAYNGLQLYSIADLENEIINLKINYNGTRKFE